MEITKVQLRQNVPAKSLNASNSTVNVSPMEGSVEVTADVQVAAILKKETAMVQSLKRKNR